MFRLRDALTSLFNYFIKTNNTFIQTYKLAKKGVNYINAAEPEVPVKW